MIKIVETKVYTVDELSDEAREKAFEQWKNNSALDIFLFDVRQTLTEFCQIFDVSINGWDIDELDYNFNFTVKNDSPKMKMYRLRLARYVWNNYAKYITKGKYYSKVLNSPPYNFVKRRSKVLVTMEDCPLTGCVYDYYILQPIIDLLHYKQKNIVDFPGHMVKHYDNYVTSYHMLMQSCIQNLFQKVQEENIYHLTMENFIDESKACNQWYYLENGDLYGCV